MALTRLPVLPSLGSLASLAPEVQGAASLLQIPSQDVQG